MQALYAYFKHSGELSISKSEKELLFSVQKAFDLYHYLLILIIEIADYADSRIEIARQKRMPTESDLNPNTKFINNLIINQIRNNRQLLSYIEKTKLSWVNTPELIKNLYYNIIESGDYKQYMLGTETGYKNDKDVICNIYKNVISQSEAFYQSLEEQSIFWNDEVEFIISIIIKTIKKFKESEQDNANLLPLFQNKEDEEYPKLLLRKVILNHEEYLKLIENYSKNWEVDRIAFMDVLIMQMAIGEVLEFPSIPVKVTMNEYLELSKYYSTEKSSVFINGILDKIFSHLKEDNKIAKQGRGLKGET